MQNFPFLDPPRRVGHNFSPRASIQRRHCLSLSSELFSKCPLSYKFLQQSFSQSYLIRVELDACARPFHAAKKLCDISDGQHHLSFYRKSNRGLAHGRSAGVDAPLPPSSTMLIDPYTATNHPDRQGCLSMYTQVSIVSETFPS